MFIIFHQTRSSGRRLLDLVTGTIVLLEFGAAALGWRGAARPAAAAAEAVQRWRS